MLLVGWGVAGGVFLVGWAGGPLKLKLYLIIASMCYQATDHYYSLLDKYTLQSDYCRLGRFTVFSVLFSNRFFSFYKNYEIVYCQCPKLDHNSQNMTVIKHNYMTLDTN